MSAETVASPGLTIPQIAKTTGIKPRTIYDLIRREEIGHRRIGGRIYVPQADLETYLTSTYTPARTDTDTTGELAS